MMSYDVMLEGEDEDGTKYFVTFEVIGSSQSNAQELVLNKASKMGLNVTGVEEVAFKHSLKSSAKQGVSKVYGKSYFINEE